MAWGVVTGLMNWFQRKSEKPVQVELGRLKTTMLYKHFHFVKLPADYCSQRPTSELIESCCQVAKTSESFFPLFDTKEWLRTVIRWKRPLGANLADFEFYSNVVPRQAYMKRTQTNSKFDGHDQYCTEAFLPMTALYSGETPALQSCSSCALLEQFRIETDCTQAGSGTSHVRQQRLEEIVLEEPDINSKRSIGKGNEGEVYTIKLSHGIFAMKQFNNIKTSKAKFERGRDIALHISHPNIVRCIGHGTDPTYCALFMELLEEDLESFLSERSRCPVGSYELPFSFRDSLDVLLQIAKAVEHLHENNFLHGDLKPGNILVSKLPHSDVPSYLVKVADFGCVKPTNGSPADIDEWGIGSLHYTAPEVLRCRPKICPRGPVPERQLEKIDVYSFAVIAYQVLTGVTHPYANSEERSRHRLEHEVSDENIINGLRPDFNFKSGTLDGERMELLKYIKECWVEKPEDRPSFSEICKELERLLIKHQRRGQNEIRQHHSIRRILPSYISIEEIF